MRLSFPFLSLALLLAAGCGGGATTTPAPTAPPTPASSAVITAGSAPVTASIGTLSNGYAASVGLSPIAAGAVTLTAQLVPAQPVSTPVLQSNARTAKSIGTTSIAPLVFLTLTPSATVTFPATPSFTITFPAGTSIALGSSVYLAMYDPSNTSAGWTAYGGPGALSGQTITFASIARTATFNAGITYTFAVFATAAAVTVPSPTPTCAYTYGQPQPLCPATAFTPGPAVSPYPIASSKTLYVAVSVTNVPGVTSELLAIPEPLSAASAPTRVANAEWPGALAVDPSGRLFVQSYLQNHVTMDVFATPVTAQSTPLFSFSRPVNLGSMVFDAAGDLIGPDFGSGNIVFWAPPIWAQSLPAHEAAPPTGAQPGSLAIAGARLFFSIQNIEQILDPPYVNATTEFALSGVPPLPQNAVIVAQSVDAAGEFIVTYAPGNSSNGAGILVYPGPPASPNNFPSVSLTVPSPAGIGTAFPTVLAYDNQGRLVVGANYCPSSCGTLGSGAAELLVYSLPLTSGSTPVIIPLPQYQTVLGVASGP